MSLSEALTVAAVHSDNTMLTRVKTQMYLSGVLSHCVQVLSLDPRSLRSHWSATATLAQLVRYIQRTVYFEKNQFIQFNLKYLMSLTS